MVAPARGRGEDSLLKMQNEELGPAGLRLSLHGTEPLPVQAPAMTECSLSLLWKLIYLYIPKATSMNFIHIFNLRKYLNDINSLHQRMGRPSSEAQVSFMSRWPLGL